ncbi:MAG: TetR/AcrR family transcriptional regulator; helix-turn-helix transcriptional regulator [Hyphomonadaceae bacterium]|nr:TetR/AcrR family transcriptional regulator; helix-turn-helix transcriptional regulator [Hyphomonadaceae bacterium]
MSAAESEKDGRKTRRYAHTRARIVEAASLSINELGVKGMTFADVGQRVDLNTTSLTYYFKRKELLAEAAFERSMNQMESIVRQAGREANPRERVSAYLRLTLEEWARVRRREEQPTARLSDLRAMEQPLLGRLIERWVNLFRETRETLFGGATTPEEKSLRTARTAVLIENVFWLPAWLNAYSTTDFPRVHRRLFEIFDQGLAIDGAAWSPRRLEADDGEAESGAETFLRAATRLINDLGYRGASVDRIAATLQVTKGSFYHHLEAKDDLVVECFERSYDRVSRVQAAAIAAGATAWDTLSSSVSALTEMQFFSDFPLLRTVALQALPADMRRHRVIERSDRMARRFAGIIADGVSEGSIRAVDPMIASQVLMSTVNNAYELRSWASRLPQEVAVRQYGSTVLYGFFRSPLA